MVIKGSETRLPAQAKSALFKLQRTSSSLHREFSLKSTPSLNTLLISPLRKKAAWCNLFNKRNFELPPNSTVITCELSDRNREKQTSAAIQTNFFLSFVQRKRLFYPAPRGGNLSNTTLVFALCADKMNSAPV